MNVDTRTYNKATNKRPPGHGYSLRKGKPTSIVVHSTSNPHVKNTAFDAEARFLRDSADVSAHYLIGKDGRIVQFLEPAPWVAWHAGSCQAPWENARSIGIELHHSVGDPPYPQAQKAALAWLLRDLCAAFDIPHTRIETHGQIAIDGPYNRKKDPSDWVYADFIQWRNKAFAAQPSPTPPRLYRTLAPTWISERPDPRGPIALQGKAILERGEVVQVDEVRADGWGHVSSGVGFVAIGGLEAI